MVDDDKNSNGCSLLSHEIHRPDNDFVMARIEINSAPALYGTKCTERPVHHHWPPRCNWLFMFTGSTLFLHQQRKANTGYNSPIPRLSKTRWFRMLCCVEFHSLSLFLRQLQVHDPPSLPNAVDGAPVVWSWCNLSCTTSSASSMDRMIDVQCDPISSEPRLKVLKLGLCSVCALDNST